jgi:hypothetical protein
VYCARRELSTCNASGAANGRREHGEQRDPWHGPCIGTASTWGGGVMLGLGMVVLGLATFAAMIGFIALCDRV